MPQPQPQPKSTKPKRKPANLSRAAALALAAGCALFAISAGRTPARPVVQNVERVPLDSSLFFVLDDTISSKEKAGETARAHLRDPIVIHGVTVAAAGTPVEIEVSHTSAAQAGNVDGFVDIFFKPMRLPDGRTLPLITPTSHLDPHMSAGMQSTQNVTDTVGDIFIPYHLLYHVLRKGSDVVLKPGTVIRARTGATISIQRGAVAISTPPPLVTTADTPHPAFMPAPLATPPGYVPPTPKPSAKPTPTVRPATTP